MKKFTIDVDDFLAPGQDCVKPIDVEKKTASISLTDCLACSGCITSAETVLITMQSTQEFLSRVEKCHGENGLVVVSVASEVIASFAAHYSVSFDVSFW